VLGLLSLANAEMVQVRVTEGPWEVSWVARQSPEVLGGHGDVVVDVAGDLLRVGAQGRSHVVRVEEAGGHAMHQLHHVPVPHGPRGVTHHQLMPPGILHDPPVVDIFEGVTGHLLLV